MNTSEILLGFLLGGIVAFLAYRAAALSLSGALAAALTGGLIFGLGGLPWAVLLLTFFLSSSGLSRAFSRQKTALTEKFAKGSRRDWSQVVANGGLGALLAVAQGFAPGAAWPWIAFAGAMAAVNADTWATELGVLSPSPPRLVTTGRVVERGTSGGISLWGTLAGLGGAALVGLAFAFFTAETTLSLFLVIVLGGLAGSLFDSLLGASVQGIYFCPTCQKETERYPIHACGTPTVHLRGWRLCSNEIVNFTCSLVGALVAASLWFWLFE